MSSEWTAASKWIYQTLKNDPALTIVVRDVWQAQNDGAVAVTRPDDWVWADEAPAQTAFPYIVFNCQAAIDTIANRNARVKTELQFYIRVVTTGRDTTAPSDIYEQVDKLLSFNSPVVTVDNLQIYECHRLRPVQMLEKQGERVYRIQGGVYSMTVSR